MKPVAETRAEANDVEVREDRCRLDEQAMALRSEPAMDAASEAEERRKLVAEREQELPAVRGVVGREVAHLTAATAERPAVGHHQARPRRRRLRIRVAEPWRDGCVTVVADRADERLERPGLGECVSLADEHDLRGRRPDPGGEGFLDRHELTDLDDAERAGRSRLALTEAGRRRAGEHQLDPVRIGLVSQRREHVGHSRERVRRNHERDPRRRRVAHRTYRDLCCSYSNIWRVSSAPSPRR